MRSLLAALLLSLSLPVFATTEKEVHDSCYIQVQIVGDDILGAVQQGVPEQVVVDYWVTQARNMGISTKPVESFVRRIYAKEAVEASNVEASTKQCVEYNKALITE